LLGAVERITMVFANFPDYSSGAVNRVSLSLINIPYTIPPANRNPSKKETP
jgi:hypothetical protein